MISDTLSGQERKIAVLKMQREKRVESELLGALRLMGHRNWIVIADSAYPEQACPGIRTIPSGMDQLEVVSKVLAAVEKAPHVRGIIYLDKELEFVPSDDAPGIERYRQELGKLLEGQNIQTALHEDTIHELDEAAKTFRVLIIKTNMTLPYTSVFVQLDCGYWSAEAEKRLRERMEKNEK
jgi:L-fucose mutarotase/ribose pyranase (RbsD/FucU family)